MAVFVAYLFILSSVNFVGFLDPEEFIHIPGAFKFTDLLFLLLCFIYCIDIVKNHDEFIPRIKASYPINALVYLFICMVILQIVVTAIRFDVSFISTIKVSRGYFYLLFYFYLLRFFNKQQVFIGLAKLIIVMCIAQFVFLVLQIMGADIGSNTKIIDLAVNESSVTRVYIDAYFYVLGLFSVSLLLLLGLDKKINKNNLIFIVSITSLTILLSYTRTYWIAMVLIIMMSLFFTTHKIKRTLYKSLSAISIVIFPFFLFVGTSIVERIASIFEDIGSDDGNFIYRFSENPQRLQAFLDYPLLGPGFVHYDYAANIFNFFLQRRGLTETQIKRVLHLQTNDSGLITWLVSFGSIGVIWVFALCWVLYRIQAKRFQLVDSNQKASLLQGNVFFIFAIWLTCTTTYGFSFPDGVVALSVSLYFIAFTLTNKRN